jgi:hypothetical protein
MSEIDWSAEKGIADEPTFDRFIQTIGGQKISSMVPNAAFENADYLFIERAVVAELKILETEFSATKDFDKKVHDLIMKCFREIGMRGPLLGQPYPPEFVREFVRLFRPPLARIDKNKSPDQNFEKNILHCQPPPASCSVSMTISEL